MGNILADTYETFAENIRLVLIFSIPFIIAFIIPLLAPLPTYVSMGGIFLRSASIFTNLDFYSIAVILLAFFFSLLFISFAFVAISLIVKSRKTRLKIGQRALRSIEKYTGRVFILFIIYAIIITIANIIGYYLGIETFLTGIVGFLGFIPFFYAPSAVVVDEQKILRSMKNSIKLVANSPQYFILWFLLITISISIVSLVFMPLGIISEYIVLIVSSLIILPYFVIFQAEAYMKRFAILKH